MLFLETLFLYFLPAALIPLVLSLFYRLNRRRVVFPSLMLLEELLDTEMSKRKLLFRLKQVLRALIVLLITLAFSEPVFRAHTSEPVTVVIDPTVSMARFDVPKVLAALRSEFPVKRVFFGDTEIGSEDAAEPGRLDYDYRDVDMSGVVARVEALTGATNILLVTDGQTCNYTNPIRGVKKLWICQLRDDSRNVSVEDIAIYPGVGIRGVPNRFTVKLAGTPAASDRIRIELDGREIYSGALNGTIRFERFIETKGAHVVRARIEGDDFTNDNVYYATVASVGTPSVYSGIDSPLLRRTLGVIFPELYYTRSPQNADFVVDSSLAAKIAGKPVVLFCENPDRLSLTLRRDWNVLVNASAGTASGAVSSVYPVMNALGDMTLDTKFVPSFGAALVEIGGVPVVCRIGNYTVAAFSLRDNEDKLSGSVFLLFLLNETVLGGYREEYFVRPDTVPDSADVYDASDDLFRYGDLKGRPGVYKLRDGGKMFALNVSGESRFEFLDRQGWNRLQGGAFQWVEPLSKGPGTGGAGILLAAIALVLIIVEMLI